MNSLVDCTAGSPSFTSYGYNLDSDYSCHLTESEDLPGVDPLLGPLQDSGGDTKTHTPSMDSPAVDAGDCAPGTSTANAPFAKRLNWRQPSTAAYLAADLVKFPDGL